MIRSEDQMKHDQIVMVKGSLEEIVKDIYYIGKALKNNDDLTDHKPALILAFLLGAELTSADMTKLEKDFENFYSQERKEQQTKEGMLS